VEVAQRSAEQVAWVQQILREAKARGRHWAPIWCSVEVCRRVGV